MTQKAGATGALQALSTDAADAAWRLAGSQFLKLAREPIVALLSRHLGPDDDSIRGRVAEFLETELGAALLAGVLAAGLTAMPGQGAHAPRLAQELRVRAMAGAGDVLADVVMGPLREVAVSYLQDQPVGFVLARDPDVAEMMKRLDCGPEVASKVVAMRRGEAMAASSG